MESLAVIFGGRVRALREARRWTQEQLAKATGLGTKHIGVIERGEKASSFEAVEKLAKAFEIECFQLFVPHDRRTTAVEKEIDTLLRNENRISLANVDEFLRRMRSALKTLDGGGEP